VLILAKLLSENSQQKLLTHWERKSYSSKDIINIKVLTEIACMDCLTFEAENALAASNHLPFINWMPDFGVETGPANNEKFLIRSLSWQIHSGQGKA